ncbi:MAG: CxxC motif-containing protein (DUF1111 family) [Dokdonia sp.]|jgi:CxxC motif-containing protein (DUF1111 family)
MRKRNLFYVIVCLSLTLLVSCSQDDDSSYTLTPEEGEELSGGDVTSFNFSVEAFGFAAPDLTFDERITFGVGNSLFNQSWVTAPASTTARDGLGPLFNSRNCSACHFKDGRGRPPTFDGELDTGLLVRLSIPGTAPDGSNLGHPVYGGQFQDNAILTVDNEGILIVSYEDITITYPDGNQAFLQKPTYSFTNLNYGPLDNVQTSPRVAQQMIGLGLLDAIPESTLMTLADPSDIDNDGISGRPNMVFDVESNTQKVGRYGWKANQPTIKQQVAAAFSGDLGITSPIFPEENCPSGIDCTTIPNGGSPEISEENLNNVTFYSSTLSVPARRDVDDDEVLRGKQLFTEINCAACHTPKIETGAHPIAVLANQTIRPYTDLLLHDMGEDLADNTPDFDATGKEWRTQPLWGIGLIETVNDHTNLLHDGRARNIEEAILWHGGEATTSKNDFMSLSISERQQLITFINSL